MKTYMWCQYCDNIKADCQCARPSIVLSENDHLEAVEQARADALRWVLKQLNSEPLVRGKFEVHEAAAITNYKAILHAIIEKELSK